ncbi:MAG TPA: FkbM family methyltransferase [Actinomycetota bacterium]|nr:FkbM family methyltransferase [Actinomycetota bacterium]
MRMVSYGQNFEDVVLNRMFPDDHRGFYIDVGAYDPVSTSVTRHFYERGWRGINVEPSVAGHQRLVEQRPRDLNLNVALSNTTGSMTFFEGTENSRQLSTLSGQSAQRAREAGHILQERRIEVTTLAEICAEHVTVEIDFLSVDVEGHEHEVLQGADWDRWRPRVVVVEAVTPDEFLPSHEAWEPLLLGSGYRFGLFDGLNRFYVREEEPELLQHLRLPANATDNFVSQFHMFRYATLVGGTGTLQNEDLRALQTLTLRFPKASAVARTVVRAAARRRRSKKD